MTSLLFEAREGFPKLQHYFLEKVFALLRIAAIQVAHFVNECPVLVDYFNKFLFVQSA